MLRLQANGRISLVVENDKDNASAHWLSRKAIAGKQWHHVAATWRNSKGDASDATIYLDGEPLKLDMIRNVGYGPAFRIGYSAEPLFIGRDEYPSGHFKGSIKGVTIIGRIREPRRSKSLRHIVSRKAKVVSSQGNKRPTPSKRMGIHVPFLLLLTLSANRRQTPDLRGSVSVACAAGAKLPVWPGMTDDQKIPAAFQRHAVDLLAARFHGRANQTVAYHVFPSANRLREGNRLTIHGDVAMFPSRALPSGSDYRHSRNAIWVDTCSGDVEFRKFFDG